MAHLSTVKTKETLVQLCNDGGFEPVIKEWKSLDRLMHTEKVVLAKMKKKNENVLKISCFSAAFQFYSGFPVTV